MGFDVYSNDNDGASSGGGSVPTPRSPMTVRAIWSDGFTLDVRITRFPWWLKWWPSRNMAPSAHRILEGGPVGMNDVTMRHELEHCRDYVIKGTLWMWNPLYAAERERRAHAAESSSWPTWEVVV